MQPTPQQMERCELMGWEYLGDGIFARGNHLGSFIDNHWIIN